MKNEIKSKQVRQWVARLSDGDSTVIIKRPAIEKLMQASDKAVRDFGLRLIAIHGE